MTAATFEREIGEALKAYDKYIVCIDKTPEDCAAVLGRLVDKAIKVFEDRAPGLRHGIALDKQITVILSQTDTDRPLCGIYFNLYSPHHKKPAAKAEKA